MKHEFEGSLNMLLHLLLSLQHLASSDINMVKYYFKKGSYIL